MNRRRFFAAAGAAGAAAGDRRYVEGWYRDRLPHLYVSRGIGTSLVPVRVGSRPEVAIFRVVLG